MASVSRAEGEWVEPGVRPRGYFGKKLSWLLTTSFLQVADHSRVLVLPGEFPAPLYPTHGARRARVSSRLASASFGNASFTGSHARDRPNA